MADASSHPDPEDWQAKAVEALRRGERVQIMAPRMHGKARFLAESDAIDALLDDRTETT